MKHSFALALFACLLCGGLNAAELNLEKLQPVDRSPQEVIDHYVAERLAAEGLTAAALTDDANLLRRTMLDLVGRIPTAAEVQAYVADSRPEKRVELVERLLESPAFARQQANEFDAFLMEGTGRSIRDYLRQAFTERKPWDQIFRELLVLGPIPEPNRPELNYMKARIRDLDKLTNDVSVMFFGVNVSCAQCHDHPLVSEWTQSHFFGMKSFFSRTFENGDFLAERGYGLVQFKTTAGEEKRAPLMFLSGAVVEEPESVEPNDEQKKQEKQQLEEFKTKKQAPPAPGFSRRAALARFTTQAPDNQYFSQAIVNRVWYLYFGYGLVSPLDQMHPENSPSHPELLAWLARDLVDHQYDLRRLIRGIVLSDTYARSSAWDAGERPYPSFFAVANVRPLSPSQYANSLRLASMNPDRFRSATPEQMASQIEGIENQARGLANHFEQPKEGFQVSVTEALLLSNNEQVSRELLRDSDDALIAKLKTLDDIPTLIDTAVWNTWSREPSAEERQLLTEFFQSRQGDRVDACKQLVWVLLTASELRFNY